MFPTLWNIDFCACNLCDWVGFTLLSQNRAKLTDNAFSADHVFTLHYSLAAAGPSLEETASSRVLPLCLIGHMASKLKLLPDEFRIFSSKRTGSDSTLHNTPNFFPSNVPELLYSVFLFFLFLINSHSYKIFATDSSSYVAFVKHCPFIVLFLLN